MALTNIALMRGIPTIIGTGINATGTSQSNQFSVIRNPMAESRVAFQAIGTFTVLSGTVEASLDGGTTWGNFTDFDFVVNPIFSMDVQAGTIMRFNFKAVTQSLAPNILAVLG